MKVTNKMILKTEKKETFICLEHILQVGNLYLFTTCDEVPKHLFHIE